VSAYFVVGSATCFVVAFVFFYVSNKALRRENSDLLWANRCLVRANGDLERAYDNLSRANQILRNANAQLEEWMPL